MRAYRCYGPPGTGKSTFLLDIMHNLVDRGVVPEDIVFTSYTNATINAAQYRLSLEKKPQYFKTTHAICYRLLGLSPGQIMNDKAWEDFGKTTNYDFTKQDIDSTMGGDSSNLADKVRTMYSFSRHALIKDYNTLVNRTGFYEVSLGDLNAFATKYKHYKQENNKFDFEDMLEITLKKNLYPDARYLFCDEYQDFSVLMDRLIKQWIEKMKPLEVYIAGDDDQCVPKGTIIETDQGKQRVETIKVGDKIISGSGYDKTKQQIVLKTMCRDFGGHLIKITTESGKKLSLTPEHKIFVHWKFEPNQHCTYLMRQGNRFRIGISSDCAQRARLERNIDGIMPLSVHQSVEEARKHEILTSLKYGVPTLLFPDSTDRGLKLSPEIMREIFDQAESENGARNLLQDQGKFWHPLRQRAVIRGRASRKTINIYPLLTKKSPMIVQDSGTTRIRKHLKDLKDAYKWIDKHEIPGEIIERWLFLKRKLFYRIPAANVLPYVCYVPVLQGMKVIMEKVISVDKEPYSGKVYDLEIARTHNFAANGIIISNCLYSFMAADPRLLNDFPADETIMLTKSYRLAQNVIDIALKVINRNKNRTYKELESSDKTKHCDIYRHVTLINTLEKLPQEGSIYMLARTNYLLQGYIRMMHYNLIPYKRANGKCIWDRDLKTAIYYINEFKRNPRLGIDSSILHQILKYVPSRQSDILPRGIKTKIENEVKDNVARNYYLSDFDSMGMSTLKQHILNSPPEDYLTLKTYKDHISFFTKAVKKHGNGVLMQQPRHVLSTIHGIKGGEADHVLLFPGLTRKVITAMDTQEGRESENRVCYVGLTRTKQSLHLITPFDPQFGNCGRFYEV